MVCEIHFSDAPYVRRLIGVTEVCMSSRGQENQRKSSGTKQAGSPETRAFLSGWETGVDSQLAPPKVVYTIRTISNKRDMLGSLYGKSSARVSKPFAFIHSLDPEAYLRYYADEHSYLANLFVQPSVQRLTACLIAPPSASQPLVEPSATPPPPPLPQIASAATSEKPTSTTATTTTTTAFDGVWSVAKKYSLAAGVKTQTRIQGALSEPSAQQTAGAGGARRTASNLSQQVDSLTNGRARGDIPGDRKSDSLSLIAAEVLPDMTSASVATAAAPPRRVSTPDRARQRDFTCPGFTPALLRRLETLAAAEAAAEASVDTGDSGLAGAGEVTEAAAALRS